MEVGEAQMPVEAMIFVIQMSNAKNAKKRILLRRLADLSRRELNPGLERDKLAY